MRSPGALRGLAARTLLASALAIGGSAVGCNLIFGIEEQGPRPEIVEAGDEPPVDSGPAARPAFEKCSSDSDCVAPNACYTPHCDRVLGACTYALCEAKGETCAMSACDKTSLTCSTPRKYGFRTTTYAVLEATSGCGPRPDACVAATFPFLFLGTRDTVIAMRVDDLLATAATKVTIEGVGVKPTQLVPSGRRLWVLGAPQGTQPPYQLPLASIDVPSDPTVTVLRATTTFVPYPFPSAVGFPAPDGALYVALNDAAQGFPTALVQAPVSKTGGFAVVSAVDAGTYDASPYDAGPTPAYTLYRAAGVPPGAALVASSGQRLVVARPNVVNLIDSAGTSLAGVKPDQPIVPPMVAYQPPRFTQGPDGVVALAAVVNGDQPAPDCDCITYQRAQWMLPNAIATTFDQNQLVNVEGYRNPPTNANCYSCAYFAQPSLTTWIDGRTLLAAAPGSSAGGAAPPRERTAVRMITRDPITAPGTRRIFTRASEVPKGNFATDRIALTSSNGFGYLVMADGQGNSVTVSVFDPRCDVLDGGAEP